MTYTTTMMTNTMATNSDDENRDHDDEVWHVGLGLEATYIDSPDIAGLR